jgi:hypothetical protein
MIEKLRYLRSIRPSVKHRLEYCVVDQMLENYPDYFDKVVIFIRGLGDITEKEGHSKRLDDIKNSAYKLIGI